MDHELRLISRDHFVPSSAVSGLQLRLRERTWQCSGEQPPLLMIHGATIASVLWDNAAPGWSWMDMLARAGIPTFALDLRGYGRSRLPQGFTDAGSGPFARASDVQCDVSDAIEFIRDKTGARQVDLLGGSWGSVVCGMFASGPRAGAVRRLVLYAPLYSSDGQGAEWRALGADSADPSRLKLDLGPRRGVSADSFLARWNSEIPVAERPRWRDEAAAAALVQETLSDVTTVDAPGTFSVPTGAVADLFEVFVGRPLYAAEQIMHPVLLVRGEHDQTSTKQDADGLFAALGSTCKRNRVIRRGAHFMVAERCLPELHSAVADFLLDDVRTLLKGNS